MLNELHVHRSLLPLKRERNYTQWQLRQCLPFLEPLVGFLSAQTGLYCTYRVATTKALRRVQKRTLEAIILHGS